MIQSDSLVSVALSWKEPKVEPDGVKSSRWSSQGSGFWCCIQCNFSSWLVLAFLLHRVKSTMSNYIFFPLQFFRLQILCVHLNIMFFICFEKTDIIIITISKTMIMLNHLDPQNDQNKWYYVVVAGGGKKRKGKKVEGKNDQNEGNHAVVAEGGRKHFIVSVSRHISHFSYTILSSSLSSSFSLTSSSVRK